MKGVGDGLLLLPLLHLVSRGGLLDEVVVMGRGERASHYGRAHRQSTIIKQRSETSVSVMRIPK